MVLILVNNFYSKLKYSALMIKNCNFYTSPIDHLKLNQIPSYNVLVFTFNIKNIKINYLMLLTFKVLTSGLKVS